MLPHLSSNSMGWGQQLHEMPSGRLIERYREKAKRSAKNSKIEYDGAFKKKASAHDERIGLVQSHIALTRALRKQVGSEQVSPTGQNMLRQTLGQSGLLNAPEFQRSPSKLADESLAYLMKSSAILT